MVLSQVGKLGLADRFEYVGEPDLVGKVAFLQGLSVFCLPTKLFETRGLAVMEALAARVPVVVPRLGCFPELLEAAPGGIMYPPGDCGYLASTLEEILAGADEADAIGKDGAAGIEQNFTAALMAERFEQALESC